MRRAALALLGLAGCQDPSIDVAVALPPAAGDHVYADDAATVTVSVLLTEDYTCDDVAFGLVDEEAIALAEVSAATFRVGGAAAAGGALSGVPRLGNKLWVAEVRDADGVRIAGGCTTLGDIEEDVTVAIATEPVADVTTGFQPPDEPLPATIDVRVDDGFAVPLPIADRPVRWAIRACPDAQATASAADALSGDDGLVSLPLEPRAGWGPQSLEVRARWGSPQPLVVPGFQGGHDEPRSIPARCGAQVLVDTADWRAIAIDGEPALVGLARGASSAHLYVATRAGDACLAVPDGGPFAAFRDPDGLDHAIVATATDLHGYTFAPGIAIEPGLVVPWTNPTGAPPRAVVPVRRCRADDAAVLLVQLDDAAGTLVAFRADGSEWADSPLVARWQPAITEIAATGVAPRITAAGCLREETVDAFQTLLVEASGLGGNDPAALRPRWVIVDGRAFGVALLPVPSFGAVAFSPEIVDEPVLLGGVASPTGPKVVRWRVTPVDGALELREEVRDDALGPPASLAIGHLDTDGHLDTVWGLVDAVSGGVEESRVQLAERCGLDDDRVVVNGVSEELAQGAVGAAAVFLAPVGDGTANLMIGAGTTTVWVDTTP